MGELEREGGREGGKGGREEGRRGKREGEWEDTSTESRLALPLFISPSLLFRLSFHVSTPRPFPSPDSLNFFLQFLPTAFRSNPSRNGRNLIWQVGAAVARESGNQPKMGELHCEMS